MKKTWKRAFSMFLTFCMVATMAPAVALAEETNCTHQHDENCGYVAAVEGQPCGNADKEYVCDHTDCGYVAAVEGVPCGNPDDPDCTHETCGYVEAVEGVPCPNEGKPYVCDHTDCGYVAAVEGQDCGHICDEDCVRGGTFEDEPATGTDETEELEIAPALMAVEPRATAVAEVGGQNYETLLEAVIEAKTGETVRLLRNYEVLTSEKTEYNLAENCTLDLGGNTLTVPFMTAIFQGKNITIQNGTVSSGENYSLWIGNETKETIATVKNLTVEGGINICDAKAVLENVTATGRKYYAVWSDWQGDITVKSGNYSVDQNYNPSEESKKNEGLIGGLYYGNGVRIEGGNFTVRDKFAPNGSDNIVIVGGTFVDEADAKVDVTKYIPAGSNLKQDTNGAVIVDTAINCYAEVNSVQYQTLAAAVEAVPTDGTETTITLLKNNLISSSSLYVTDGKNIILDLNNYKLTLSPQTIYLDGATLKVQNGTIQAFENFMDPESRAIAIAVFGSQTDQSNYSVLTIAKDVVVDASDGHGIVVSGYKNANNYEFTNQVGYGAVVNVEGTIKGDIFVMGNLGNSKESAEAMANSKNIPVININDGANIDAETEQGIALNGYAEVNVYNASITGREAIGVKRGILNIYGGNLTAEGKVYDPPIAEKSDTDKTGAAVSVTSTYNYAGSISVNIYGGNLESTNQAAVYVGHSIENDAPIPFKNGINVNIEDGNFSGNSATGSVFIADKIDEDAATYTQQVISGGYFTSDPADYVIDGKASVESDKTGYAYMIGDKTEDVIVKLATAPPEVNTDNLIGLDDNNTEKVEKTAESVSASEAISEAAKTVSLKEAEKSQAVEVAAKEFGEDADVIIYKQTYLDIEATRAITADDSIREITLNITPMMQIVASTATTADKIDENNAVKVGDAKVLTISTSSEITVTLPDTFKGETVYIKHEAKSGTYFYTATADTDGVVTFTSKHGFSPFTFSLNDERAAVIDGVGYASLQEAVDAVQDGQTITVLKDGQSAKVTGRKSFTVKMGSNVEGSFILTAGSGYRLYNDGDTYTVKKKSSSSSSSSSSTKEYTVSVDDKIENGKVKADVSKAEEGDKVTITVTPNKGYEINKVTVKDADGDKIEIKDKGDGKYTFTMPDSKVEIKATFSKIDADEPVEVDENSKIVLTINQRTATVFGEMKVNDVAPVIRNDRTMLPIRFVAEALGGSVVWNDVQKTVTIVKDETVIVITIGSAIATVNGQAVVLDAPAFIENSRTYLPLRFVAENLGADVTWNADTQQVIIVPDKTNQ